MSILTIIALSALALPASNAATPDYTQRVVIGDSSHATISFTPTTAARYVDVHYLVSGTNQQNVRMTNTSGTWSTSVANLKAGSVITYWFTYEKNGPQYDTGRFTYTQGTSTTPPVVAPPVVPPVVTPPVVVPPVIDPATPDYTQRVVIGDSSHATISFTPTTAARYVDVHYLVSGTNQQNVRMTNTSGTWSTSVANLKAGSIITYWFTYEKNGPQYDTGRFTYTQGTSTTPPVVVPPVVPPVVTPPVIVPPVANPGTIITVPAGLPGAWPATFQNNTGGAWSDSQVYITIFGLASPGQWSYVQPDGSAAHVNHLAASASDHLTKNGVSYPNMSFTLAQASTIQMPPNIQGGRIYISLGSPLFISIPPDDSGWAGPNPNNSADPNISVYYDWYEFTFVNGQMNYAGNTTQVDMYGLSLTTRVQQTSSGFDQTNGITMTRQQVMSQYTASVGAPYKPLANQYRILSPRTSPTFSTGGTQGNYFTPAIDAFWAKYAGSPFAFDDHGFSYRGQVVGDQLRFTENGAGPYTIRKPSSQEVMECSGSLATGVTAELRLGADLCAAFNRSVATDPVNWNSPAAYYKSSPTNDFARFFHSISIGAKAYGFAYDDVNNQSSVAFLPNSAPPSRVTIGIGW